jgi:hypothetical protein
MCQIAEVCPCNRIDVGGGGSSVVWFGPYPTVSTRSSSDSWHEMANVMPIFVSHERLYIVLRSLC